jgi:hypothetical protein
MPIVISLCCEEDDEDDGTDDKGAPADERPVGRV